MNLMHHDRKILWCFCLVQCNLSNIFLMPHHNNFKWYYPNIVTLQSQFTLKINKNCSDFLFFCVFVKMLFIKRGNKSLHLSCWYKTKTQKSIYLYQQKKKKRCKHAHIHINDFFIIKQSFKFPFNTKYNLI